jgi:tRNA (cytidine/uridine-2'-O-)-methyltransferase
MIQLGGLDQRRVDVDADHPVPSLGQHPAQPAWAAAGIEDVRFPRRHRVDESSLACKVLPGARHGPEALDVPVRMSGVGSNLLHPDAPLDHVSIIAVFKVLFFSPRIAPNTGNAIRMVAATGCELHLVQPLGFDLSEPKLRRAGLDYHDLASVTVHRDLPSAWEALAPTTVYAFTAHAEASFADVGYRPGDTLMFGPEPTGLDAATLTDPHISGQVRIPMLAGRRSLNLSNAAAVAVYEAWRQHGFRGAV